jgi:hypothetical protein
MKTEFAFKAPALVKAFTPQPEKARMFKHYFVGAVLLQAQSIASQSPAKELLSSDGSLGELAVNKTEAVQDVISYILRMLENLQTQLISNFDMLFVYDEDHYSDAIHLLYRVMSQYSAEYSFRQAEKSFREIKK